MKNTSINIDVNNIEELPLKATYKVLMFYGQADGTLLTQNFLPADIENRVPIIKSIQIVPYYDNNPRADIELNDGGANYWTEFLPALSRMDRIIDTWATGTRIVMEINGSNVPIFTYDPTLIGFPIDLHLDNIFYKYPAKIQDWNCRVTAECWDLHNPQALFTPLVKVIIECYLI